MSDDIKWIEYIDLIDAAMEFRREDHRAHVDEAKRNLHDAHVHTFYWTYVG